MVEEDRRRVLRRAVAASDNGHPGECTLGQPVCVNCPHLLPGFDEIVTTLRGMTSARDALRTNAEWAGFLENSSTPSARAPEYRPSRKAARC